MTGDGGVKCWGYDVAGTIGDSAGLSLVPTDVPGLGSGVAAIAAGSLQDCALTSAGGVKCRGHNSRGQLGDGTTTDHPMAVDVVGLSSGVRAIAAGGSHNCALTSTGGVRCWGDNADGELGDGTAVNRSAPVDVIGLSSGVRAIAAGAAHSCALTSTGGVKCWGLNQHGELGNGTTFSTSVPVDVSGLKSGVIGITAGGFQSCALLQDGGVKCWGSDASVQLGDDTITYHLKPASIDGFGAPKAVLAVASPSVSVTRTRVAALTLRCGPAAPCSGTVSLAHRQTKLGSGTFSMPPGATRRVGVKITPRAFVLLVRAKRLSTVAAIVYRQPGGGTTTATRTITLVKK